MQSTFQPKDRLIMSDNKIATLVPGKSDQEIANELKKKIIAAYEPLCQIADECNDNGMAMQVTIGPNAFGKFVIQSLQVIKVYK